mgnify:FL=1
MTQIRKNLITNVMCLIANVLVGLLYTPYLVKELGVVTYGVLPIALVVNQYIIILTDSLQSSVTRFYSLEYRQKNYKKASVYFSSAIAITILLAVIVLPVIFCLLPQIEALLHIPDKFFHSAGLLIAYTVASLFVAVCSNCVNITIYSDNRLDLINYLKILRNLAKLVFNITLFTFLTTDVSNVGLASVLAELLVLVISIIFYKITKSKEIQFGRRFVSFKAMKPIAKMLTWVSLMSFSGVFIYKIDAILVNNYFGLYNTGILGAISEFGSYCISITGCIGVLSRPLMLIAYSEGRHDDLVRTVVDGAYIVGLISSLLCGIVMGLSVPILKVWLNDEISHYWLWLVIKMFIIPITTFGSTYSIIYNLWNNVRSSALWSLAIAVIYVGTSVALLELGVNMTAFLIIGAVAAIMQGAVLHIAIYSHIYPQSMPKVYVRLWRCCAYFALVFGLSFAIDYFINASNLFTLLVEGVLALLVALCVAPIFINAEDLDALDVILPIKTVMRWLNFNWTRQNA